MHFLVTGATGFIGRSVVDNALRQGHQVTALVRSKEKFSQVFSAPHKNLEAVLCADLAAFQPSAQYDALIHLAWEDVGKYSDPQNLLLNLCPQYLFLSNMVNAGITDITIAGTCFEYGLAEGALLETSDAKPVTFYGLAKATLFEMLSLLQKQQPTLILKWLRFFYVYGEHQRPNSLLLQLLAAIDRKDKTFNMSPGDQQRDFINIETLARNVVMIAQQKKVQGIINLGNGRGMQVIDFIKSVMKIKNYEMNINPGFYPYQNYEPFRFWADTSKLQSIPGVIFDDRITLKE